MHQNLVPKIYKRPPAVSLKVFTPVSHLGMNNLNNIFCGKKDFFHLSDTAGGLL